MVKASLLLMLALTVLIAFGLRWREQRMPQVAAAKRSRLGLVARGKKGLDRWVNAAALAALATLLLMGGLHWLNVWRG
jgi:hypothetical protein